MEYNSNIQASTSRISDLPENTTVSVPSFLEPQKMQRPKEERATPSAQTYQPMMDIHKNPYGVEKPSSPPVFSQQERYQSQGQVSMPEPQPNYQDTQYQLPSRDYPRETAHLMIDEQIQPNHIPKPKLTTDFIGDFEDDYTARQKHKQTKYRKSRLDEFISEFQTPIFVAFLFFLFQLPTFQLLFMKYFGFLSVVKDDGNMTFSGYIVKSVLFAGVYYMALRLMDFLTEV